MVSRRLLVHISMEVLIVVIADKVHWILQVRADEIKPLFTPKV
jgi:hypothetical protein